MPILSKNVPVKPFYQLCGRVVFGIGADGDIRAKPKDWGRMEIPLVQELPERPVGENALHLVRAARVIADRFFEVWRAWEFAWFADRRNREPWMFYFRGKMTRHGLMLVCDEGLPRAVLTPWGPWVFAGSGTLPSGRGFLDNPAFMEGLVLGPPLVERSNPRLLFYPVLKAGGVPLPEPELCVYAPALERAERPGELVAEWLELYAATN